MASPQPTPRLPIGLGALGWLRVQLQQWQADGLISPGQADAILARYEPPEAIHQRRRQRLFLALCGLAVLMCAAGLILLIGYNWDALGRPVKVGMVFALVAGLFAASAWAYGRQWSITGELLALAGVLAFGSAIWLLAQVYHIESHYPDGIMWWMIGALLTAHLLGSRLVGTLAAVLMGAWTSMESGDFERANYLFLPAAAVSSLLAWRLRSYMLLLLNIAAVVLWLTMAALSAWDLEVGTIPLLALAGCALFAAGLLAEDGSVWQRLWQVCGLLLAMVMVLPLTFADVQGEFTRHRSWLTEGAGLWPAMAATALLAAVVAAGFIYRRSAAVGDWPVLLVAVLCTARLAVWPPVASRHDFWAATLPALLFNGLAVLLAVWLILRGLRLERALSYFAGILYGIAFVLARWISLIGDMLSSALLFFLAGAALFVTAWFWRARRSEVRR